MQKQSHHSSMFLFFIVFTYFLCNVLGWYFPFPGQFPFVVAILNSNEERLYGGIAISTHAVLTTCSAVALRQDIENMDEYTPKHDKKPLNHFKVIASNGDWTRDPNRQTRTVGRIEYHPNCEFSSLGWVSSDFGILLLTVHLQVTWYVKPMKLSGSSPQRLGYVMEQLLSDEESLFTVGWGSMNGTLKSTETELMATSVIVHSNEICMQYLCASNFCEKDPWVSRQFCASATSCLGVPGSPLLSGFNLIAILSMSINCSLNFPLVYSRIDEAVDFYSRFNQDHSMGSSKLRDSILPLLLALITYLI